MAWMLIALSVIVGNVRQAHQTMHTSCDVLEINHMHDHCGRYVFTQLIAWRVMPEDGRLHTVGWRMVPPGESAVAGSDGRWFAVGRDPSVIVRAPTLRTSWSQIDPESTDRRKWYRHETPPNVFDPPAPAEIARVRAELARESNQP